MTTISAYLNFTGNTEEVFNFYKSVFGGEFAMLMRYKDSPEKDKVSADEGDKLMHISLPIGNGCMLMGTDAVGPMGLNLKTGNNFHISLSTESKAEADKLYKGLSAGGSIMVPLGDTFWGDYFAMFTDKYGTQWMISYHPVDSKVHEQYASAK